MDFSSHISRQIREQSGTKHKAFKKYYDTQGVEYETEPQKCCAKHIFTENGINMFYIKMNFSEDIYHPVKNRLEKPIHIRELGKVYWEFKKVKESVFAAYLSFLKTGNELFYTNASRGMI